MVKIRANILMLFTCNDVNETLNMLKLNRYLFCFFYINVLKYIKINENDVKQPLLLIQILKKLLANYLAWPDIKVYTYFSMTGEKDVLIM